MIDRELRSTNTAMSYEWTYPVFLIPHGVGYVSLVDANCADKDGQLLVVYSDAEQADAFMTRYELPGSPRALNNAREFRWLLGSVKAPVTQVVFDPAPTDEQVNPTWQVGVAELLGSHLIADNSPWNYPVYTIAQAAGFAGIDGVDGEGNVFQAVGIFSSEDKAGAYLQDAVEEGTVFTLDGLDETVDFLRSLSPDVTAVAADPVIVAGRRTAKHCFLLETLFEKYLVRDPSAEE